MIKSHISDNMMLEYWRLDSKTIVSRLSLSFVVEGSLGEKFKRAIFFLFTLLPPEFWTKRSFFSFRAWLLPFDMWASLPDGKLNEQIKMRENNGKMTQHDILYLVVNSNISTSTSSSFKISVFCLHLRSAAINVLWHCRIWRTALWWMRKRVTHYNSHTEYKNHLQFCNF